MSETVKLIIEISKSAYEEMSEYGTDRVEYDIQQMIKNSTPLEEVKAEINEEREFARDDFPQYKIDVLGVDPETVDDEYPNDEFHEGMERVLEIIDNIRKENGK